MSDAVFSLTDVHKRFGKAEALRGLDLEAPAGSIIGLLGRNGAGKTTALRCLVGLQRPTRGTVRVFDEDPWRFGVEEKRRIGYLAEGELPFPHAKVRDLIDIIARLHPRWDASLSDELLDRFRIARTARVHTLSSGQHRALGLLLALCPRPDLLLLDEPAANLDPVLRRRFLKEVLDLVAEPGRTVLFSSHILSDVERVADRVAIIEQGRVLLHRPLDELKEEVRRIRLRFPGGAPGDFQFPAALRIQRTASEILLTVDRYTDEMRARLAEETGADIHIQTLGLEDLFLDLVGDDDLWGAVA